MWNLAVILILAAAVPWQVTSLHSDAGPWIQSTKGEVWPRPKSRVIKEDFYLLRLPFEMHVSSFVSSLFHRLPF